jgi:AcrR family transcriptional regulator
MSSAEVPPRSTAEARRATVIAKAVTVFGKTGYHATPVTDVAEAAGISQAYVFRLFVGKLGLFVAALDHCFEQIVQALEQGADRKPDGSPAEILEAMGDAYADLIADRDLLMLQVHAQSAADEPTIR